MDWYWQVNKFDLSDKTGILPSCICFSTIVELYHLDFNELVRVKFRITQGCYMPFRPNPEWNTELSSVKRQLTSHLTNHPGKTSKPLLGTIGESKTNSLATFPYGLLYTDPPGWQTSKNLHSSALCRHFLKPLSDEAHTGWNVIIDI